MPFFLPPVYPITDKRIANKPTHFSIIQELARGGAILIQIRDKETPLRELLTDLYRCVEFCKRNNITILVNDRCDIALSCGADGVHLGQEDLPPEAARALLGRESIIGFSMHTLSQVRKSHDLPVQYIGFGPIFPTSTKKTPYRNLGLSRLRSACSAARIPVVAIGGIGPEQIRLVLDSGAASAAVISSLMSAKSIARRMEVFLEIARERG